MPDRGLQAEKDIIRLPLYSDDYNRIVPAGSRGFVDATISTAPIQPIHDAVLLNCWAEKDQQGAWTIVKRPGIATASGDISTSGLGGTATGYKVHALLAMQALPGVFVALVTASTFGTTHIVFWSQDGHLGVTDLGALPGGLGTLYLEVGIPYLSEINIGGYPGVAAIHNYSTGSDAWYYVSTSLTTLSGGTVTEITDADFPSKQSPVVPCRGAFVQLNEHIFIMGENGKIYNSDQASISSWNVRGVQPASIEPDAGVGLAKYKQHIVAFGTNSMEFFEDAGLAPPGGPLQRTEQAFIKIGAVSGSLIYNIADTLYWVAQGYADNRGLYKLDQYTPMKVSTPAQSPWLDNVGVHARLGSIMLGGCQHIYITNMQTNSGVLIATPYLLSEATFTPAGSATESYPPTVADITPSLLCYNINHNSWWWWTDENIPLLNLFTASTYSQVQGYYNRQIIIKSSANTSKTSSRVDYIIFTIQDSHVTESVASMDTPVAYTDNNGTGTQKSICVGIQLAPLEFNIESRKIINKMKLSADAMVKYDDDASTGNQLYFVYNRLDGQGTTYSRAIVVPSVNHRYFINNLGTTRKLYVAILCKTAMAFRAKSLELHVTQATG